MIKIKVRIKRKIKMYLKYTVDLIEKGLNLVNSTIGVDFFNNKGKAYLEKGEINKAKAIYIKGLRYYKNSYKLNSGLANIAMKEKEWFLAVKHWNTVVEKNRQILSVPEYIEFSRALRFNREVNQAEYILSLGLTFYPKNKRLLSGYANIATLNKDWESAATRWDKVFEMYKDKISLNAHLYFAISNGMIGENEKFSKGIKHALRVYSENIKKDKLGYRKVVLFDNGETRIEYYKKLQEINRVIITFDSIDMTWNNPPFGFNLLIKEDVDIIAVRKKQKKAFHQDLSREEFYNVLKLLVGNYNDRIAYGYSLGGYTSLYFASQLGCRILAISPRNSIHPVYGKPKVKGGFNHLLSQPYNPSVSPIIVYDPKNLMDRRYVEEELKKSYPRIEIVEIPYGGHGIAPHLLKMDLLKKFILTVLNNEGIPKYDNKQRIKSSIYFRVLGSACLRRNKPKWALDLVNRSLELLPNGKLSINLKINTLKKLGNPDEAVRFLDKTIESYPKDAIIRNLLIELHVYTANLKKANEEIDKAIIDFGESKKLVRMKKEVLKNKT